MLLKAQLLPLDGRSHCPIHTFILLLGIQLTIIDRCCKLQAITKAGDGCGHDRHGGKLEENGRTNLWLIVMVKGGQAQKRTQNNSRSLDQEAARVGDGIGSKRPCVPNLATLLFAIPRPPLGSTLQTASRISVQRHGMQRSTGLNKKQAQSTAN